MTEALQASDPVAVHGEGPVWFDGWGGLKYVDMLAGDVLSLTASGAVDRLHVSSVAALVRPRQHGGMVVATERSFRLFDADGTPMDLPPIWADTSVRMNEGTCDPQGRLYCGSMAYDERPRAGALYRLDARLEVTRQVDGATVSNGLAWSPTGDTAYYADSALHRIDAFDYDPDRGLTSRRTIISIPADEGAPDGLIVDADGYLWVAMWKGGAVRRYAPTGRFEDRIELPVAQVTACTFGGADLTTLYITTSRYGRPYGGEPLAGAVFAAEVGIRGIAVQPFAG